MKEVKRTFYEEFLDTWTLCSTECGACFYHGPIIPHNFVELPPPEWSPPSEKCPSYEYFKFRAYTAVGRGDMAANINDDEAYPIDDELMKVLYTCTGCGMCSEICYKLRPLTANLAIREVLVKRGAKLPDPLPKMDAAVEKMDNIFGATRPPKGIEGLPLAGEDLYFAGCVARYQRPESIKATTAILRKAGIEVGYLADHERCCGFVPSNDGNTAILEKKVAQNIEAFQKAGAKRVIVSCAHCYKTLKVDYRLVAGELPFEVVHVAELFSKLIDEKSITFTRPVTGKITYHDPCFLGRYCYVLEEPRKVLRSIPGVELAEMEPHGKWSHCCGSGMKITSACYPDFSAAMTRKRLEQGRQAATNIVTACTTCYQHMKRSASELGMDLDVFDLPLIVADAMGINLE
jgi:heterodisulfide reductase subunit D